MPRLDDVIADILPEAQNAPADVLKKAMLDAARTLCRRSKVWRVDVEGTLIPGIAQVELELPRETSVVDVAYLYTPTRAALYRAVQHCSRWNGDACGRSGRRRPAPGRGFACPDHKGDMH